MTIPIRVLIVEDDPKTSRMHRLFVDSTPRFTCIGVASTATRAIAMAGSERPDLILLDLNLPDGHGLEVLRGIRATDAVRAEIIAVTAIRNPEVVGEARRLGVRHYLLKPFSAVALLARLNDVADLIERGETVAVLDQRAVDDLLGTSPRSTTLTASLPKGISPAVLDKVRDAVLGYSERGVSTDELSVHLGLSRSSVRRYLEYLVSTATVVVEPELGRPNRPTNRYRSAR